MGTVDLAELVRRLSACGAVPVVADQPLASGRTSREVLDRVRGETLLECEDDIRSILCAGADGLLPRDDRSQRQLPATTLRSLYDLFFGCGLRDNERLLVISGGSGSNSFVRSLVAKSVPITLLVNGYDDGKSTGALRRRFEVLGPSDVAKNFAILLDPQSPDTEPIRLLLNHRLPIDLGSEDLYARLNAAIRGDLSCDKCALARRLSAIQPSTRQVLLALLRRFQDELSRTFSQSGPYNLADHAIRNLIFLGAYFEERCDYHKAIGYLKSVLGLKGDIVLNQTEPRALIGLTARGTLLTRQDDFVHTEMDQDIIEVGVAPNSLKKEEQDLVSRLATLQEKREYFRTHLCVSTFASGHALAAIRNADAIVFAPTTQECNLIPTLMTGGIAAAICENSCPKIVIANMIRERSRLSVGDMIQRLLSHLPGQNECARANPLYVLTNNLGNTSCKNGFHDFVPVDLAHPSLVSQEVIVKDLEDPERHGVHQGERTARLIRHICELKRLGCTISNGELVSVENVSASHRRAVLERIFRYPLSYERYRPLARQLTLELTGNASWCQAKLIRPVRVIISAAGTGTRLGNKIPKALYNVADKPLLKHALEKAQWFDPVPVVLVSPKFATQVRQFLSAEAITAEVVVEDPPRGAGLGVSMVLKELSKLADFPSTDVVIMWVDAPNLSCETIKELVLAHQALGDATLSVSTAWDHEPYAGLERDSLGNVTGAFFTKEDPGARRAVGEHDASVFVARAQEILDDLNDFASSSGFDGGHTPQLGFFEVTGTVAQRGGKIIGLANANWWEASGVNTPDDARYAEEVHARVQASLPLSIIEPRRLAVSVTETTSGGISEDSNSRRVEGYLERMYEAMVLDIEGTIEDDRRNIASDILDFLAARLEQCTPIALLTKRRHKSFESVLGLLCARLDRSKTPLNYLFLYSEDGGCGYQATSNGGSTLLYQHVVPMYVSEHALWCLKESNLLDETIAHYQTMNKIVLLFSSNESTWVEARITTINDLFEERLIPLFARRGSRRKENVAVSLFPLGGGKDGALADFARRVHVAQDRIVRIGNEGEHDGAGYEILDGVGGFSVGDLGPSTSHGAWVPFVCHQSGLPATRWLLRRLRFDARRQQHHGK